MDYRDNRQRWAESHQVVHFYAGQWCTFTPALTLRVSDLEGMHEKVAGAGATGVTEIVADEFGRRAFSFDSPDGYFWTALEA